MIRFLPLLVALVACTDADTEASLEGTTYALDFTSLAIADADPGMAVLVRGALASGLLMNAVSADVDSVSWRLAIADNGAQDTCSATLDLPEATLADGSFEIGSSDIEFPLATGSWTLSDMTASGDISADLQTLGNVTLVGTVDARELVGVVPLFSDADAICSAFAGYGLDCAVCASDGGVYCATVAQSGITAAAVDETVEKVTESCTE